MSVNTTWVDPSASGALDLSVGSTLTEPWSDALASDFGFLGGTDGRSGYAGPRPNMLVNGGFEIWQRGNGAFTANNAFAADRWSLSIAASDTLSVSKSTSTVSAGSIASAAITYTKSTGGSVLNQILKLGADGHQLQGKTVSFTARANTSTAGSVWIRVTSDGTGGTTLTSSSHSGSGTWETLTVAPYTVPTDATFVEVYFLFTVTCSAFIDNAMLVQGPAPAEYIPLVPAEDLLRCQRYYLRFDALSGSSTIFASGMATAAATSITWLVFPVRMAGAPTLTISAAASFGCWQPNTTVTNCTGLVAFQTSAASSGLSASGMTLLVAGNATFLVANTTTAWLAFEYNP